MVKQLYWVGQTRLIVKQFEQEVRAQIGYQLYRVQQGLMPNDWKPLQLVGGGAIEIRLHKPHEHRVVYVAKFGTAVYVLHAFAKKTRQTSKKEIRVARQNYRVLLDKLTDHGI